jgi:hypothetical protein
MHEILKQYLVHVHLFSNCREVMKWLLLCGVVVVLLMQEITCPPVQPEIKPIEGDSPDDMGEDPVS